MSTPRVSVAMSVFNGERYLPAAVRSILDQTYSDFEFLIVDDGSTDNSRAILDRYASEDRRIHLSSRPNTGLTVALNELLGLARGEYVARMDADDISLPQRLERQVQYLDAHPECVLLGSRVRIIDPDGDAIRVMGDALTHEEINQGFMEARGQMIYHPAVMFRRQSVLDAGGYRTEHYTAQDLDLFLRLAEVGRVTNLAEPLLQYREHLEKIGYKRLAQQKDSSRRALLAACERRGVSPPAELFEDLRGCGSVDDIHRAWGWSALSSGYLSSARKHAWACIKGSPLSFHSWRLLYCSLRGY